MQQSTAINGLSALFSFLGIFLFIGNASCLIVPNHVLRSHPHSRFGVANPRMAYRRPSLARRLRGRRQRLRPALTSIDRVIQSAYEASGGPGAQFGDILNSGHSRRPIQPPDTLLLEGDIVMSYPQFLNRRHDLTIDGMVEHMLTGVPLAMRTDALKQRCRNKVLGIGPAALPHFRRKRAASTSAFWPNGMVPIRIQRSWWGEGFSFSEKERIAAAMNEISEKTGVCFRRVNTRSAQDVYYTPHVRIVNGQGCSSYVGMQPRRQRDYSYSQDVTLHRGCRIQRVVCHELLHALGLWHEQSRTDRDEYVKINMENAEPWARFNFDKQTSDRIDSRGIDYDYLSIMHYGPTAFSSNGQPTIEPIPESNRQLYINVMGKVPEMSDRDAAVLRLMYNTRQPTITNPPPCPEYPYNPNRL